MTETETETTALVGEERTEAFAERLFGQTLSFFEVGTVYLGIKLGLYEALAAEPSSVGRLSASTGIAERYAREWLEQQAASGILEVDDPSAAPEQRIFSLPEEHAPVVLDPESPASMIGPVLCLGAFAGVVPRLLEVYRTGEGIPLVEYGDDFVEGQGAFNRPAFVNQLADEWLAAVPGLRDRLRDGARVADVACGAGWASIALARAFPGVRVDGIDLDEASIAVARKNAAEAGVADRVTFEVRDAGDPGLAGSYDAVFIFEAVHDMARPVEALRATRALCAEDGVVIVMDERAEEEFTAPASEVERFFYAVSALHCLPVGLAEQPSAGTGTLLRPATMRAYAREAGFSDVEILPIDDPVFRFYRLVG